MSPVTSEPARSWPRPLVLVVEDRPADLQLRIEHLEERDCAALGFEHSDEAITAIFNVPGVDAIITDIDLTGTGSDRSGLSFAKFVAKARMDIPVYGYSAFIDSDDLSSEESGLFTGSLLRKSATASELNDVFDSIADHARSVRRERSAGVEHLLSKLRQKHGAVQSDLDLIRDLVLTADPTGRHYDDRLASAGYRIMVLWPRGESGMTMPILTWVLEAEDGIEVEAYGFPELYATGDNLDEAISRYEELIGLVQLDLLGDDDSSFQGAALRLKAFLSRSASE